MDRAGTRHNRTGQRNLPAAPLHSNPGNSRRTAALDRRQLLDAAREVVAPDELDDVAQAVLFETDDKHARMTAFPERPGGRP